MVSDSTVGSAARTVGMLVEVELGKFNCSWGFLDFVAPEFQDNLFELS